MIKKLIALVGIAVVLVGCGGGGVGSSLGQVATFFTDSMDGNDHVWVTVYKVELVKASGPVQVFGSEAGKQIDLKTLRDSSGERFAFIANGAVPHEPYTGVRVTMDKNLVEFPAGATSGVAKHFADAFDDGAGKTAATFTFSAPKRFSSMDSFVIDFDLANWDDGVAGVSPVVKEGASTGIDDSARHEDQEHNGVVSNLHGDAPSTSFTISGEDGSYTVQVGADTSILNSDGSPSPSLANGEHVNVRGQFTVATHTLAASRITIKIADHQDEPNSVEGPTSEANGDLGTFVLTVQEAEGFVPGTTTMTVHVNADTKFFSDGGQVITQAQFFAALTNGRKAEARGSANASDFTALSVKLETLSGGGGGEGGHVAEFKGLLHEKNLVNNNLNISPTSWEAVDWTLGHNVGIIVNGDTVFKNANGDVITEGAFYEAIAIGTAIEVHGHFDGVPFYASDARILPTQ